jgi:two-component system, cell cycle response regulator DivK
MIRRAKCWRKQPRQGSIWPQPSVRRYDAGTSRRRKIEESDQRDEGVFMTRVLLVDDDEMSRDMLSRRLIRRGFEVIFAVDGKQGVEAARREKPDIILMDMGLPVMDGWEATRCIKSDDATRGVSVIGLSARTMSGDRDKAIEAGCDDYDVKPIEFDRLIGKIERLLGLAKIQVR